MSLSTTSPPEAIAEIARTGPRPEGIEAIYLFGSARHSGSEAKDVDVLIVYSAGLEREAASTIARPFREALRDRIDLPVHLLLLSPDEVRQVGFVESEDAVQLWPTHPKALL